MMRILRLNHNLDRSLNRYATRMLNGARRPPPPNYLSIACRLLRQYVRWREKTKKEWIAREREYHELIERERRDREFSAVLEKVYGPEAVAAANERLTTNN